MTLTLPPTTRVIWASAAARREWEPKVELAAKAWHQVERDSVAHRLRQVGQEWIAVEDFADFQTWLQDHDLPYKIARFTGRHSGFLHGGYPPGTDMLVVIYGAPGESLTEQNFGYPACCVRTFMVRMAEGDLDPMPFVYSNYKNHTPRPAPNRANPLLRYIGVRALPHIPCSFVCQRSLDQASLYLGLMPKDAMAATVELLGLPVTWDRYRGVAIVTTPHFRIVTTSTPKAVQEVIDARE